MAKPKGPFCQSCGMPMDKPEDFGTEASGSRNSEYCHYCYEKGAFTTPNLSLQAMIDICVDAMAKRGVMPAPQARMLMTQMLPGLKRWRTAA
jgi:hypothetical protein